MNMSEKKISEILSRVEKPSRYLGTEANSIRKDPARVKLRFALAFPDLYEIGTSHFGIQILYHVLNSRPDIAAERVFTPDIDMERRLQDRRVPLFSLETRRPLSDFDIVGFSLLYELNYTNVLTMLHLAGIPFLAGQRQRGRPLVIAGGPCTCNPEPVAELFDALVVGDGERAVLEMADAYLQWKEGGAGDKTGLLRAWADIAGVYVPSFFRVRYGPDGTSFTEPDENAAAPVERAVVEDLDDAPFPDRPVVPFGKPVHDRLRLEISRGCTRGCRFCQAGMIYRPVRERGCDHVLRLADDSLRFTGYEDLSLLSLSTGDYSRLSALLGRLMERCGPERIAVSLPSFRAGSLTEQMMERIQRVRKTGFTIAPEAGSQRLRDVINKNLTYRDIEKTVKDAFSAGWQVIKLYFMIGLPTEQTEDHDALVDLVYRLRALRKKSRRGGQINVSVTTFIPKAHTPFQWMGQLSMERSGQILAGLRERLKAPGIRFKWQDPRVSFLEGLFARGDRRLTPLLVRAWEKGCRLDGWSDRFRYDLWQEAIEEIGVDTAFFTTRTRDAAEPLPWDHIDMGVCREYLENECKRALEGRHTPDCRWGQCNDCGVCDFDRVKPLVDRQGPCDTGAPAAPGEKGDGAWLRVLYEKTGEGRYFGHLEMVSLFSRALRKAGLHMAYSKGFHPKPRLVFAEPLPVGMESEREAFDVLCTEAADGEAVRRKMNALLPAGLRVIEIRQMAAKTAMERCDRAVYRVLLTDGKMKRDRLEAFSGADQRIIVRRSGKGTLKKIDLKDMVIDIDLLSPVSAVMTLRNEPGRTLRPAEVLAHVFGLGEEEIKIARILKRQAC